MKHYKDQEKKASMAGIGKTFVAKAENIKTNNNDNNNDNDNNNSNNNNINNNNDNNKSQCY